ncbi:MAG: dolichyl-phosphate beta-glucosyltransferase [Thermoanaerobaculales bacterium]
MWAISIVIPALDEARRLPPNLDRVGAYLAANPAWLPAEIIVVDDGSVDGTAAAARTVALPPSVDLKVAVHPRNRGKGAAVRTGFGQASARWVLLSDADLSTPIEEIEKLAVAATDSTVVIGSRAVDRCLVETPQPWYRDAMGRIFNVMVRALVLGDIRDTQCGFKLFPGDLARALSSAQRLDGFAFDVELLLLARRWGFSLREVGVRWRHVEASRVLPVRHSGQMLRDLARIWVRRAAGTLPGPPKKPS